MIPSGRGKYEARNIYKETTSLWRYGHGGGCRMDEIIMHRMTKDHEHMRNKGKDGLVRTG